MKNKHVDFMQKLNDKQRKQVYSMCAALKDAAPLNETDEIATRIRGIVDNINDIFKYNHEERQNQLIHLLQIIAYAPDRDALEKAITETESAIQAGVHNAKVELINLHALH